MRRAIAVVACLTVLIFAGASTALARGPHHGGSGFGPGHHHHQGQRWNNYYRRGVGPVYWPRYPITTYPVYPYQTYQYPYVPTYPQLGFGLGGRNFSLWFQQ